MEDDLGSEEGHMRNRLHVEAVDAVVIVMMFIGRHCLDLDLPFELDHIHDLARLQDEEVPGQRVHEDNVVDVVPVTVVMTRPVQTEVGVIIGIKGYVVMEEWDGNMSFTKCQPRYHPFSCIGKRDLAEYRSD